MGFLDFISNLFEGAEPDLDKRYLKTFYETSDGAYQHINKAIKKILKRHEYIKIGKSGDAIIRKSYDDYRGEYSIMYLVARSKNPDVISYYEKYFIKRFYNDNENVSRASGGKMITYNGYYYLYVVAE